MARNAISLDEKIDMAQAKVATTKAKYDAAVNELEKLLTKRQERDNKKLIEAFANSEKTLSEVLAFLQGDIPEKG